MNNKYQNQLNEIGKIASKINHIYEYWAKRNGISYNILAVLYVTYTTGSCTQKAICDEWFLPKQTVNAVCKELRIKGYLLFDTADNDKREKKIRLSEQGVEYARPIIEEIVNIETDVIQQMGETATKWLEKSISIFCDVLGEKTGYEK